MKKQKREKYRLPQLEKQTSLKLAEKAIQQIAMREHTTSEMVRKHIQTSMINGLASDHPEVQAAWRRIPCMGEIPTPEEVIAYYAGKLKET